MKEFQKKALRHFRKSILGFTQEEIASRLGISQKVWSTYETGLHKVQPEIIDRLKNLGTFNECWLVNGIPPNDLKEEMVTIPKRIYERFIKENIEYKKLLKGYDPTPKRSGPASEKGFLRGNLK